jgi:peroxisomal coenzyme A diphosphatase NUDT7
MPSNSDDRPGKPINLYKFHKPRLHLYEVRSNAPKQETKRSVGSDRVLVELKLILSETRLSLQRCIRNLANYHPPKVRMKFPRSRCAAVLVALFVGRLGDLYVLLCR